MAWSKADLHIHTTYSDGRATPAQVVAHAARRTDLAVIAITDHDTIDGAREAAAIAPDYGIEVVVGAEISTREGHVLALFIERPIAAGRPAAETIAAIHAQGGLAVPAHPCSPIMPSLGRTCGRLAGSIDGLETFNASLWLRWNNRRAQRLAAALGVPALGGSDAHELATIGAGHTRFPGRSAADLRQAIGAGRTEAAGAGWGFGPNAQLVARWLLSLARRPAAGEQIGARQGGLS